MTGDKPKRDVWHHAIYRQQAHKGELFIDGKLIGRNDRMPILAEIFKDAPANCWIGRAPFRGDKYLSNILFITASKSVYTLKMLVHGLK